ncbi:MAG: WD40 repeat domain-containing protein, partial [Acidimicrobiia bacterium]
YITTSRTREDHQRAQRRRRRQVMMSGFAAAAVVAAVLAIAAVIARNDTARQADLAKENQQIAETNRALAEESAAAAERNAAIAEQSAAAAEEQRAIADAQRLVASAGAAIDSDPDLALLLALEGVSRLGAGDVTATGGLREALSASRSIYTYRTPDDAPRTRGDLSPDGTTLAVVGSPGTTLEVVDVDSGAPLWDFAVETARPSDTVLGAKFINDGSELALSVWFRPNSLVAVESAPPDVGVHVFDTSTGELLRRFDVGACGASREHFERTDSVGLFIGMSAEWIEENGCGFKDAGTVFNWFALDLNTGERTEIVAAADSNVNVSTVALGADGRVGAIASIEGVEVIDIETGELLMASDGVFTNAAAVSPDGTMVAFGGSNINDSRQIFIHDVATGDRLATIPGHAGSTLGAWFTSDGRRLITSGEDGTVKIWDATTGLLIDTIRSGQAAKSSVGISADERRLAIFSFSDTVTVASLDPEDAADIGILDACDGGATGDQFYTTAGLRVRENRVMVYAGCDGDTFKPAIFDIETREVVVRGPNMVGQNADLSPDATTIAGHEIFRDPDRVGTIVTTNLETGAVVAMQGLCVWEDSDFDGPDCGEPPDESYPAYAWDVDFSPDGRFIAMAPWSGGFGKIWDSGTGESLATLAIDDVEFSPSSDRVVVLSMANGELQLWDTEDFAMIVAQALPGSDFFLDNLRFTPDGSTIVAAGLAGTDSGDIIFYDATTLEETRRIIAPHEAGIRHIAISDDGTMLATAGADGVVKVWNLASGEILQSIRVAVDDRVQAVAFANEDKYLLATAPRGPVLIFALDTDELMRTARSRLVRGFTQTECDQYFQQEDCPTLEEMRSS